LAEKLSADYQVTIFFTNDNIYPALEYQKRLKEAQQYFQGRGLKVVAGPYDHGRWLKFVAGLEQEPERGRRCLACYRYRLALTADFARLNGFAAFASTLAISPHKNALAINTIGEEIAKQSSLEFLAGDWKKQEGFKKSSALSRQYGFYRQNYCGCEFSLRTEA